MGELNQRINHQWRMNNLYFITDKDGQVVKFKRNPIQNLLSQITAKRKIVLKSRQVGISTDQILSMFDHTMFTSNLTSCILAHEDDAIAKLFRIPRKAHKFGMKFHKSKYFPDLDRGGGSKYEMYFPERNSRIYCDLESRGDTIHRLHISEYAFAKDPSRVKATIESVPINGHVTIETTPNGMANDFYREWVNENTNYAKCFYPWFFMPEYVIKNHGLTMEDLTNDEIELIAKSKSFFNFDISLAQIAFRRFKQRELKELFAQEYPENDIECFLSSGTPPFDLKILKPLYDAAQPPLRVVDGIKIYKEFQRGKRYIVSADTSEGYGGDASSADVFEVERREQVATFNSNKIKVTDFPAKLEQMSKMYSKGQGNLLLGVERNNHGHAVLLKLDEILRYPNLYKFNPDTPEKLGWQTDQITRPVMMQTFIEGVQNGTAIIHDKETLGQCLTLVNNNGKIEAEDGNQDDKVISAAIGVQMCIAEGTSDLYSDIEKKILI